MAFTKINAAGIGTTETVTVDGLTVINDGSFGGNLTVSGVLTYEDVTNVDSVGLITARNGIEIGARPGVGASISVDGNAIFSGITTATTLRSTTGIVTTLTATGLTVDSGTTNTVATFKSSDAGAVINLTDSAARSSIEQNDTALKIIADTDASDADSKIQFQVDASTKATIDSSGRLLLNTTTEGNAGADDFTIGQITGSTGITIRSGTTNNGNLYFSDGTSGDDEYRGSIQYQHANNSLHIATNAVERLRISSGGQVRINTSGAPSADLHVGGTGGVLNALFQTSRSSGAYHKYALGASGADLGYIGSAQQISSSGQAAGFAFRSEDHIEFCLGGSTERIRIDSSGRFLHGHAASRTVGTKTGQIQVIESGNNAAISIIQTNNAASAPFLCFGKTRSANDTGSTIVQNGDSLGQILFAGADGSDVDSTAALITAKVDGTPGSNDMPGKLVFATTADGASTATPAMEINSVGIVTCRNIPSFLIHIGSENTVGSNAIIISEDNGFTLSATGRNAHNFGNHFNEADGKFTVPIEGLYFFGYSIMRLSTSGTGAVDIRIMKNGTANSLYSRNYQGSYQTNFQAEGNATIARLKKNDYIQFRVGANMSIHDDDSYFYGYLIG